MKKIYRFMGAEGRTTIPLPLRQKVGFSQNDLVSFEITKDEDGVLIRREKLCDCTSRAKELARVTLFDFLNNLTPEQQRAALIHLSVKWAEQQEGGFSA